MAWGRVDSEEERSGGMVCLCEAHVAAEEGGDGLERRRLVVADACLIPLTVAFRLCAASLETSLALRMEWRLARR